MSSSISLRAEIKFLNMEITTKKMFKRIQIRIYFQEILLIRKVKKVN